MSQLLPPAPPMVVFTGDDDGRERLRFRIFQLMTCTLTILVAVWFTTFGSPLVTILTWVTVKHILVAVLMMGLHTFPRYRGESQTP
jgi:hypothetical protein